MSETALTTRRHDPQPQPRARLRQKARPTRGPALGRVRPAFSMLELMIAIMLLGLGLVMAATIFPVAIDQHRKSVDRVSAAQVARNARSLINSFLAPNIDPGRDARTASPGAPNEDTNCNGQLDAGEDTDNDGQLDPGYGWYDDNRNCAYDGEDANLNHQLDAGEDSNGNKVLDGESVPRGPIRGDSGMGYHLLHFETIFDARGYPIASNIQDGNGALYVDVLNDGPGTLAWNVQWSPGVSVPQPRAPWFRVEDTLSPAIRWIDRADLGITSDPGARQLATTGSPFPGQLSRSSYVWHVFYRRPKLGSSNKIAAPDVAAETHLTYIVSVCRVNSTTRFAFQDITSPTGTPPRASNQPAPLEAAGKYSLLPVPWLVSVAPHENAPRPLMEWNGATIVSHDPPDPWGTSVSLSQLAPRGARLLGQDDGKVYTVIRSPGMNPETRNLDPSVIEVLPEPPPSGPTGFHMWLFPPPVVVNGNNVQSWQSESPLLDWYD